MKKPRNYEMRERHEMKWSMTITSRIMITNFEGEWS